MTSKVSKLLQTLLLDASLIFVCFGLIHVSLLNFAALYEIEVEKLSLQFIILTVGLICGSLLSMLNASTSERSINYIL